MIFPNQAFWKEKMNADSFDALKSAVMALPEAERAKLAKDLVASLDGPADPDVAEAWDIEICRRINQIEKNPDMLLDTDEVLRRARARLSRG